VAVGAECWLDAGDCPAGTCQISSMTLSAAFSAAAAGKYILMVTQALKPVADSTNSQVRIQPCFIKVRFNLLPF